MFCPNCGHENKNENKFCMECGYSLQLQNQNQNNQNSNYQPYSGTNHNSANLNYQNYAATQFSNKCVYTKGAMTIRLVTGIISIILSLVVVFQSCATGVVNSFVSPEAADGTAGFFLSILMLTSGIISIAARKTKGGIITAALFYLFGAILGFANVGIFKDLAVWSVVAIIFAILLIISLTMKDTNVTSEGSGYYSESANQFEKTPDHNDSNQQIKQYAQNLAKKLAKENMYEQIIELAMLEMKSDTWEGYENALEILNEAPDADETQIHIEKCKDKILDIASRLMCFNTVDSYKQALERLNKIPGWKNADELKEICMKKIITLVGN